ncbi:unnamed protein product, partial [Mesorhabditis spiculigera]
MGYKCEDNVTAHRIGDGQLVNVHLTRLELFSFGAFSNVYRGQAEDDLTHSVHEVAIKKTWKQHGLNEVTDKEAVPEIRILKLLNQLNHKNIVKLLYDFAQGYEQRTCYSLVFEFLPSTLYSYMKSRRRQLELIDIKLFTWQLFRGQAHLAKANIMHRDIKPQNLLVDPNTAFLKISDFGSSTIIRKTVRHPSYHVTRYYRPPELLLEAKNYGCEVDVWSCGCVFGEMLAGRTLIAGRNADHQLDLVMTYFGVPNREQAAAMHCPVRTYNKVLEKNYDRVGPFPKLKQLVGESASADALKLLSRVLVYMPNERLCGLPFLSNPFFADIFNPETRRSGSPIECITAQDLKDVEQGDGDVTAESLTNE